MTNDQLIQKFNPANGTSLTEEDLTLLRNLTDEQIAILAKAYPNVPSRRAYLRIYDKNLADNKQLYQLTTWQNLNNLRKFSNKKNLVAYDFFNVSTRQVTPQRQTLSAKPGSSPRKVVVDLTAQEAAAELKKNIAREKKETEEKKPGRPRKPANSPKVSKADESLPDDQNFETAEDE